MYLWNLILGPLSALRLGSRAFWTEAIVFICACSCAPMLAWLWWPMCGAWTNYQIGQLAMAAAFIAKRDEIDELEERIEELESERDDDDSDF